jgi:DNA polymerase III subunit delta'
MSGGTDAASSVFAPWQQRAYDHAVAALDAGRLGHGLLICGPSGLGKRAVALRLAHHVLNGGQPPTSERTAQLIAAGTHPDFQLISFVHNKTGDKLRTEIVIEQIRDVSQKLSLTPQYGVAQVVLIDPADAINRSACNALLKTLEEPAPGRYLWLISAQPQRLPATIRSRCQRLEFRLPAHDEALAWLRQQGHSADDAAEALAAARGHPGLADEWLREDGLALRKAVASDLIKLERGELGVIETAQRWSDELADARLRHAADWVLTQAEANGLTDAARLNKLAAWFDAANRTRDLLRTTVRGDLALIDLLLSWAGNDRPRSATRR